MATTTSTQRQLVEHAAAGDDGAFESLVRLSAGRLLAIAYRILRDHHLAEVLVLKFKAPVPLESLQATVHTVGG